MFPFRVFKFSEIMAALALAGASGSVLACASCGCTLSSDWENMGYTTQPGLKLDLRYDTLNQDQLRHGTGKIAAAAAAAMTTSTGDPQEVEQYTRNRYLTVALDYSFNAAWGIDLQLPWIDRRHGTLGASASANGSDPTDGAYDSKTSDLGDIKVIGRYQGFTPRHNLGVMFGLKLPSGSHKKTGISSDPATPGETAGIDPGLQPGTGTTDAILGAYWFDTLNKDWDWFAQATVQTALNTKDDYKPGTGWNLNLGLRYQGLAGVVPQLQLNTRQVQHDSGARADLDSTGGTLVYLSPGLVVPVGKQASLYGFVQVPVYQDVRGVQLTPQYIASLGLRFGF